MKKIPAPTVRFSTDPHDPPYWPQGLTVSEKVGLLGQVAGDKFQALHQIAEWALREEWRKLDRAEIMRLLDQETDPGQPFRWRCDDPAVTKPKKGGTR